MKNKGKTLQPRLSSRGSVKRAWPAHRSWTCHVGWALSCGELWDMRSDPGQPDVKILPRWNTRPNLPFRAGPKSRVKEGAGEASSQGTTRGCRSGKVLLLKDLWVSLCHDQTGREKGLFLSRSKRTSESDKKGLASECSWDPTHASQKLLDRLWDRHPQRMGEGSAMLLMSWPRSEWRYLVSSFSPGLWTHRNKDLSQTGSNHQLCYPDDKASWKTILGMQLKQEAKIRDCHSHLLNEMNWPPLWHASPTFLLRHQWRRKDLITCLLNLQTSARWGQHAKERWFLAFEAKTLY